MVKNKAEWNKTGDNVERRMNDVMQNKYAEEIELKFDTFKSFLLRKDGVKIKINSLKILKFWTSEQSHQSD